jgi:hypothetical protein
LGFVIAGCVAQRAALVLLVIGGHAAPRPGQVIAAGRAGALAADANDSDLAASTA